MREENEIQNWCEVLSSESGKILGAHIIGPHFAVSLTLRGSLSAVSTPILQVTTRWKALDEIYKIYMLLHRSDLNISVKNRRKFAEHFWKLRIAKICFSGPNIVFFRIGFRFFRNFAKYLRFFQNL